MGNKKAHILFAALLSIAAACGDSRGRIGDPCTPQLERDATFNAFTLGDVYLEAKSDECASRLCLVNRFRGRIGCPYGQTSLGQPSPGAQTACSLPSATCNPATLTGCVVGKNMSALVPPQCANRRANVAVQCSCQCANSEGKTDDGGSYCTCPTGFACKQLVLSKVGDPVASYCLPASDPAPDFSSFVCDPCDATRANCGPVR